MCVFHCEPEEFMNALMQNNNTIFSRVYVLDEHIAGNVYMTYINNDLYYLDRMYVSDLKKEEFDDIPFYDVHKELYRKINLDEYMRKQMN